MSIYAPITRVHDHATTHRESARVHSTSDYYKNDDGYGDHYDFQRGRSAGLRSIAP